MPPFFSHLISLTLEQNPEDRPSINEIAEILDSGLIFPSIIDNHKEFNYYLKFTGTKEQNKISYEILKNLENKFINIYRKDRLATVITLYLADYFDDTKAQREIGINYYDGIKLEKDGNKAFEYISVSAEKHDEKALFYLAQCYINGIGCEENRDKAKIYLERSKNKGYKEADIFLKKNYITIYDSENIPKVIILRYVSTGKTTFIKKLKNIYDKSFSKPTLEPSLNYVLSNDDNNKKYGFVIEDTHGMEQFAYLPPIIYRNASVAIIMFAVDCENSFLAIDKIICHMKSYSDIENIIIIGNKIDKRRTISYNDAQEKASSYNAEYIEVSSEYDTNIQFAKQMIEIKARQTKNSMITTPILNTHENLKNEKCCILI